MNYYKCPECGKDVRVDSYCCIAPPEVRAPAVKRVDVPPYPRENGCRGILLGLLILASIVGLAVAMWFSSIRALDHEFEKKHAQDNAAIEAALDYQKERQQ